MVSKEKEDFDDLDALDEDSWGDDGSEDSFSGEGATLSDSAPGDLASGPEGKVKKKSSGGALVGLIVLALLGGGAWYAYQNHLIPGLGSEKPSAHPSDVSGNDTQSPAPTTDDSSNPSGSLALEGEMPPMPAAQDGGEITADTGSEDSSSSEPSVSPMDDLAISPAEETPAAPAQTGDADVLTPLPDGGAVSADNDLASLDLNDADEQEVASVAEKDGMLAQDSSASLLDPERESLTINVAGTDGEPGTSEPSQDIEKSGSADSLDEEMLTEKTMEEPSADLSEEKSNVLEEESASSAEALEDDLGLSDNAGPSEKANEPVAQEASEPSIAETVSESTTEKPAEVDALDASTESEDAPSTAPATSVKTESSKTPAAAETAKAETEVASAAPETPKAESSKPKPVVVPKWQLRSAKPGFAVLYDSRTGDVKTVEVGDRVAGLGKIKSISQVNGKWVVQGSSGKVRQ